MTNEIKEILDDLLFTTTLPNVSVKLSKEKLYQLKDYITNLQEEKQRLLESADCLSKGYDDLEEQIGKAVEYIKDNFTNEDGSIWHKDFKNIYDILRGDE